MPTNMCFVLGGWKVMITMYHCEKVQQMKQLWQIDISHGHQLKNEIPWSPLYWYSNILRWCFFDTFYRNYFWLVKLLKRETPLASLPITPDYLFQLYIVSISIDNTVCVCVCVCVGGGGGGGVPVINLSLWPYTLHLNSMNRILHLVLFGYRIDEAGDCGVQTE